MEINNQPSFDAPIPGQSLTAELGARPWQGKPKCTTVDEAIDYYMERMSSEEFMVQVVDILESGVPVTVLANTIQMAGVMDGTHTIDVGMLVLPMLMEMMMMLGDSADIEYDTGLENPNKEKTRSSLVAKVINKYNKTLEDVDLSAMEEEDVVVEQEDNMQKGLMARRSK
jgi:predicted DNA-binding protein